MKKYILISKISIFIFSIFLISYFMIYLYSFITPKISLSSANMYLYLDKDGNDIFDGVPGNKWISLEDVSNYVKDGTIAVEDKRFYKHIGFDYLRIIKAIINNISNHSLSEGASTISQQYIKNLYLTFDKTWERKIEEAFLTVELEVHYKKDEILEGYINTIDYGSGNYGIENAANYYFNKSAGDLSLAEASLLVGIPKNPSLYNPIYNYDYSKERQKIVLDSMVKNKYITKEEATEAYNEELVFNNDHYTNNFTSVYYYRDAVINELNNLKISSLISSGGLKIYTNYDKNSEEILEKNIKNYMKDDSLQVASIVIEPKTGKVIALTGGKNYNISEYNRAISSKRQVGSTMKPFLYYAALDNGFTSSSTFSSEPTLFNIGGRDTYAPTNYGNIYALRNITLGAAISYSDNIYAIKTHLFLGEDKLSKYAKKAGIETPLPENVSLPLGTTEINMLDFASGYITLANEGTHIKPYFITKITDMDDNILYERKINEELVYDKKSVFILNELLTSTYDYNYLNYNTPTLISVSGKLKHKYAVKSGSTDTDYWTIGYNKDLLTMVWVGYDDNTNTESYQSNICKNIWASTSEEILKDKTDTWYDIPNGITMSYVDPISGVQTNKNGVFMYYINGSEPGYSIYLSK